MHKRNDAKNLTLTRIADSLGIRVECFFEAAAPDRIALASECARLFDSIRTDDGRRRALNALRAIIADDAVRSPAQPPK